MVHQKGRWLSVESGSGTWDDGGTTLVVVLGMGGGGRVVKGVAEGCRRSGSRILWAVQAAAAYSPLHEDQGLLRLPVKLHTGPLTLLSGPVKVGTNVSGDQLMW